VRAKSADGPEGGMGAAVRYCLIASVLTVVVGIPFVDSRAEYAHHKRLREVDPGILYRSGQMTAGGFRDAVALTGAHTIINCQNEFPDPDLPLTFFNRKTIHEAALCHELERRYIHLDPDLCANRTDPGARPVVIDEFLSLMDDPANRPVLLHCKAGLHRTGVLVAVYRMEYNGWDPSAAVAELKANGFGDTVCTASNDYIQQYILNYRIRDRNSVFGARHSDAGRKPNTEHRTPNTE
jgi:tyrosine-protein phosphatase SIW14